MSEISKWMKGNAEEKKVLEEMIESSKKRDKATDDFVLHNSVF